MTVLSHQEIRDVQKYVNNVHYQKDIFSELPLELSQSIAVYLEIPDIIRARRVSQAWLKILGSAQTTRTIFRPWQGTSDSSFCIPESLSSTAASSLEAECIHAYRTGKAFDRSTFLAALSKSGPISKYVAYSSGRIAWIDKRNRTTHLLTLESRDHWTRNEKNDVVLSNIALSGSMMVVTTLSGKCRVKELTTKVEHHFPLTSPTVQAIVAAKVTVAILHTPFLDSLAASVETCTLHGRTVVHFSACLYRPLGQALKSCDLRIMLDASGACVVIVERVNAAKLVHFTRFGLDGHVEADDTLALPDLEGWRTHSEEGIPTTVNEWVTIWSYSKPPKETSDSAREIAESTEMLRVQCHFQRGYLRLKKDSYRFRHAKLLCDMFCWNGVAYSNTTIDHRLSYLTLIDFSTSSVEFHAFMGRGREPVFRVKHFSDVFPLLLFTPF